MESKDLLSLKQQQTSELSHFLSTNPFKKYILKA